MGSNRHWPGEGLLVTGETGEDMNHHSQDPSESQGGSHIFGKASKIDGMVLGCGPVA